jgi:hypothetical protein
VGGLGIGHGEGLERFRPGHVVGDAERELQTVVEEGAAGSCLGHGKFLVSWSGHVAASGAHRDITGPPSRTAAPRSAAPPGGGHLQREPRVQKRFHKDPRVLRPGLVVGGLEAHLAGPRAEELLEAGAEGAAARRDRRQRPRDLPRQALQLVNLP